MPSLADTWESQPLTTLLTPNASDAGERGHLCQRTAAHGGPHGPLSRRPPPGWPLGDPAAGLGCVCLSDIGCTHEEGHSSRDDPQSPGPPTWPRLSHSPGRDHLLPLGPNPSPSAQTLCRAGQRPTLLLLSAPPWKQGDAAVNKVRHRRAAIPRPTPCQPPLGRAPGWPGGAQQAGTQLPALQVTDTLLPQHPRLPGRDRELPACPPACWVPRPGRHMPASASLKGQATPGPGWW